VAETQIKITADTRDAERQIKNLGRALEDIDNIGNGAALALAGITAAAAAMGFAISKTLQSAGELVDAANALGISAKNLSYLQQSAQLAGIEAGELNNSLRKLQASIGDALVKGTGPATDALKRLGVPLKEIVNQPADVQLKMISEALKQIPNSAERSALAMDLLGKQGPRLLEAAAATDRLKKMMEDLGLALSDVDYATLDAAGDSVDELTMIFNQGLKKSVAEIAPYIIAIADEIKTAIQNAGGFDAVMQNVKTAIKDTANVALILVGILTVSKLATGAVALTAAIRQAGTAMALFNTIVKKNPLMLAVGAALLLSKVLGLDVVALMDEYTGLSEKAADKQADIATEVANTATKQNDATLALGQYNQAQQKAIDALDDTIAKIQQSASYERDKLQYGESEARIRKTIAEENSKLEKVGLSLNQQQKDRLSDAIREEESIKRQNQLRSEQASAGFGAIMGGQSPVESALQKQLEYRLLMEGKSADDIKKIREQQFATDERYRKMGEAAVNQQVQNVVNSEIGKYNQLFALEEKFRKDRNQLLDLQVRADAGEIQLTMEQQKALLDAQVMLALQLRDEKLRISQELNDKLLQMEVNRINSVLMAEKNGIAQVLGERDSAQLQAIGAQEKQKAIVADRIAFEKKSDMEKAQFGIQQGAQMFSALGAQNKKAFEAAKAFNIANAIMNTYMAATKALATYPFPFGAIAAAGAVAMGLAQVAQIRGQTYSGRQLGGPVMGGSTYMVGENGPELFTPSTTGSITRNGDIGGGQSVNVNFTIVANDTQGFDNLLISRKGLIRQVINDAMVDSGQRGF
jgi:hypothetical protein